MMIAVKTLRLLPALFCMMALAAYGATAVSGAPEPVCEVVPAEPDYSEDTQWYVNYRPGAVADLFYIASTETSDYVVAGDTCHYADTYNSHISLNMVKEIRAVGLLLGRDCNYFSPYYRQATMQSWADERVAQSRLAIPMGDVLRSWQYYLTHQNQGRPFVLCGYSQGAHAMLEILKQMPDSVADRMVAAYSIGYRITRQMLDSFPRLKPATGSDDVGVVVNYNSVRSPECAIPIVSGGNVVCINPVNWRTDTVTAVFNDSLTARCDPDHGLLIIGGYDDQEVLPVIGRPGNYHHRELKLFHRYLRRNIADRVRRFLQLYPCSDPSAS